jgi:hypothetical protein
MAKLGYVMLLGLTSVIALALLGEDADCTNFFGLGVDFVCGGQGMVYRLSLALVLCFTVMLVGTTYGPTFTGDKRWGPLLGEGFHRGFWGAKIILYIAASVGCLFIKDESFNEDMYAQVCRVVSAIFLLCQVVTLIDFAHQWNEDWVFRAFEGGDEPVNPGWMYGVIGFAIVLYGLTVAGVVMLFVFYSGCTNGVLFSVITLISVVIFTVITLFRDRIVGDEHQGAVLPAAVVGFYVTFQAWSAIDSSPDPECRSGVGARDSVTIAVSTLFATVSLMWVSYTISKRASNLVTGKSNGDSLESEADAALYRVEGEDGQTTTVAEETGKTGKPARGLANDTAESELVTGDRAYIFHFFMITASMYMAMVLTNWGTRENVDLGSSVGTTNMWVKIVAQWLAILLFIWTLIAPRVLGDREF